MQYRLKKLDSYLEKYTKVLREASIWVKVKPLLLHVI
jgi:tRNA(Phe) wybutosine-synthesizing methylase Tyw3